MAFSTNLGQVAPPREPDSLNYFACLLEGADSVDALLAVFRPHLSLVSLVRENERKDQYAYRIADGGFDVAAIGQDFADGYTIVLESVQRYVRAIASLAHSIDVELNFATQVNAYFTPPQSQGFVAHFDDHDALIVQLQGSKIWHLYEGIDVAPHEMWRHEIYCGSRPRRARRRAPGNRRRAIRATRPGACRRIDVGVVGAFDGRPACTHAVPAHHPNAERAQQHR